MTAHRPSKPTHDSPESPANRDDCRFPGGRSDPKASGWVRSTPAQSVRIVALLCALGVASFLPRAAQAQGLTLDGQPLAAVTAPRDGIGPWPYVALVAGNAADWISTYRFQSIGRYEGNPLVGQNPWVMLPLKAGGTAVEAWLLRKMTRAGHPTAAKILGYSIGAATSLIAIRNERFYRDRLRWRRAVETGAYVCDASGCRY